MAAYLVDNPPARSQFRRPRRSEPSGVVVVHTAENTPDFVAFDGGAEAVARFIVGRTDPGSYHDLADSDSAIQLVPYDAEAFHDATGSNPHSYGVSVATRADVWPLAPQAWRDGAVRQAAAAASRYATWLRARNGIVIPARRITRVESEARVPGFISHAERDPTRRTDPGKTFPWADFLATFARLTVDPKPPAQEEDMRTIVRLTDGPRPGAWVGLGPSDYIWYETSRQAAVDVWDQQARLRGPGGGPEDREWADVCSADGQTMFKPPAPGTRDLLTTLIAPVVVTHETDPAGNPLGAQYRSQADIIGWTHHHAQRADYQTQPELDTVPPQG